MINAYVFRHQPGRDSYNLRPCSAALTTTVSAAFEPLHSLRLKLKHSTPNLQQIFHFIFSAFPRKAPIQAPEQASKFSAVGMAHTATLQQLYRCDAQHHQYTGR